MAIIETEGLRKHYIGFRGGTTALDGLDLSVPEGCIYGFLGPNGAGKTTTIRCLLDLVRPTDGHCSVLGVKARGELHKVIGRIGAIVETPNFFLRFSGRRNLLLLADLYGLRPGQADEVLDRVGLSDRADSLVKEYSLGMKQRLGLAAALLKGPELLILDEPAHGLDPKGFNEVRVLLRQLGDEGRTVFLSSHLLNEVEAVCDRVAILSKGRCIAEGSVAEVLQKSSKPRVVVRLEELEEGQRILEESGFQVERRGDSLEVRVDPGQTRGVSETLAARGLFPTEIRSTDRALEDVFLELTDAAEEEPEP